MEHKYGHKFHSDRKPGEPVNPAEPYAPARGGDYGCVRCGQWTTYCMSAALADEKMGPCPSLGPARVMAMRIADGWCSATTADNKPCPLKSESGPGGLCWAHTAAGVKK